MDRRKFLVSIALTGLWQNSIKAFSFGKKTLFSFSFGSCNDQDLPQTFWKKILQSKAQLWFWLGDNIYADTNDIDVMKQKYKKLLQSQYGQFRRKIKIEGIWDDHDYGKNNIGKDYKLKDQSKKEFLQFLEVPQYDRRRKRGGIYYSKKWNTRNYQFKVYFLDCRYFKDKPFLPSSDLLGEQQWQWFEQELALSRADVNIIVSSIGVLDGKLGFTEDWDDFRKSKKRLLEIVERYNPRGTFFLSGDKHFGAVIEQEFDFKKESITYYEFQSSGLTHSTNKFVRDIISSQFGEENIITDKNFGNVNFIENKSGQLEMKWELHSLDNPSQKVTRLFRLGSDGYWAKNEKVDEPRDRREPLRLF